MSEASDELIRVLEYLSARGGMAKHRAHELLAGDTRNEGERHVRAATMLIDAQSTLAICSELAGGAHHRECERPRTRFVEEPRKPLDVFLIAYNCAICNCFTVFVKQKTGPKPWEHVELAPGPRENLPDGGECECGGEFDPVARRIDPGRRFRVMEDGRSIDRPKKGER